MGGSTNPFVGSSSPSNPFMNGNAGSSKNPFMNGTSTGQNPFMNQTSASTNPFMNQANTSTNPFRGVATAPTQHIIPTAKPLPAPAQPSSGGNWFTHALGAIGHGIGDVYNEARSGLEGLVNPALSQQSKLAGGNDKNVIHTVHGTAYTNAHPVNPVAGLVHGFAHPVQAHQQYVQNSANAGPLAKFTMDTMTDPLTYVPLGKVAEAAHVPQAAKALTNLAGKATGKTYDAALSVAKKAAPASEKLKNAPNAKQVSNTLRVAKNTVTQALPNTRDYFKQAVSNMYGERASGANKATQQLKTIFKNTKPEQRVALTHALESTPEGQKLADPNLERLRQQVEPLMKDALNLAQQHGIIKDTIVPEEMGVARYLPHVQADKLDPETGAPIVNNNIFRTTVDAAKNRGIPGTIKQINDENGKKVFEDDALKVLGHHLYQLHNAVSAKKLINTAMEHGIDPNNIESLTKMGIGSMKQGVKVPLVSDTARKYAANYTPEELQQIRTGLEQNHADMLNELTPKDVQGHAKTLRDLALTQSGADLLKSIRSIGGIKMAPGHDIYRDYTESVPLGVRLSVGSKTGRPLDEVANNLHMDANTLLSHLANASTGTSKKIGDYAGQASKELGFDEHQQDIKDLEHEMSAVNNAMDHLKGPSDRLQLSTSDLHPETKTPMSYYEHDGKTVLLPKSEADYLNGLDKTKEGVVSKMYRGTVNGLNKLMFLGNPLMHLGNNLGWQTLVHDPGAFKGVIKQIPEAIKGVQPGSNMDRALKAGALNLSSEIGTKGKVADRVSQLTKSVDHPFNPKNPLDLLKAGFNQYRELTPNVEKAYRSEMFNRALDRGMSDADAANYVRGIYGGHIAPNTMSAAERAASTVMPFFNWTKTAVTSNTKNALKNPMPYSAAYHGLNDMNQSTTGHDMSQNNNPLTVGLPATDQKTGRQMFYEPYFPALDVAKLGKDINENGAWGIPNFAFSRFNPVAKYISQALTGAQNPFAPRDQQFPVDQYSEVTKKNLPNVPQSLINQVHQRGMLFGDKGWKLPAYAAQATQDVSVPGLGTLYALTHGDAQTAKQNMLQALIGGTISAPNPQSKEKEQRYNQSQALSKLKSWMKKNAQGGQ